MSRFVIEDGVFKLFPELEIGVIALRNVDNSGEGFCDMLAEICDATREKLEPLTEMHPDIAAYKEAMKIIKKKKGATASLEAMSKRILKGTTLPSINPAVDLYNYICLKHFFTCGGETLEHIKGDMVLGFTRGNETFIPLGEEENSPPREGELVYYDDEGIVVRGWLWREADRTKIDRESKSLLIYMECLSKVRHDGLHDAIAELQALMVEKLGGEAKVGFLTKDNAKMEL